MHFDIDIMMIKLIWKLGKASFGDLQLLFDFFELFIIFPELG